MKKILLITTILMAAVASMQAQPIINNSDMPSPGDTVRMATIANLGVTDYTSTGLNYSWDFSSLAGTVERVDTFVSVTSAPIYYYLDFNNPLDQTHKATVAQRMADMTQMPTVQFTDVFNFYKNTSSQYTQVGMGITVNSLPIPIQFDDPDLLYTFPLTQGAKDSSFYSYHINIPTLGYYGQSRKRVNFVDGWGTVITPFDTFPAVRVLSTSYVHDTLHMDSLGFGFAQDHMEYEYKWLADNMDLPVFKVTQRTGMMSSTVGEYRKDYTPVFSGIEENSALLIFASIYPNPTADGTSIVFMLNRSGKVNISLLDLTGKLIYSNTDVYYDAGIHQSSLPVNNLSAGMYVVRLQCSELIKDLKLIVD